MWGSQYPPVPLCLTVARGQRGAAVCPAGVRGFGACVRPGAARIRRTAAPPGARRLAAAAAEPAGIHFMLRLSCLTFRGREPGMGS